MAKYTLHTNLDETDFALIGISCSEDQYVTCSLISDVLAIDLYLSDQIPFNLKENRIFQFSLFRFTDEQLGLDFYFVPNRSNFEEPNANLNNANDLFAGQTLDENIRLIPELPKTDYFLILRGEDIHNYQYKIIEKLKERDEIIQIQAIESKDLPNRKNLIF